MSFWKKWFGKDDEDEYERKKELERDSDLYRRHDAVPWKVESIDDELGRTQAEREYENEKHDYEPVCSNCNYPEGQCRCCNTCNDYPCQCCYTCRSHPCECCSTCGYASCSCCSSCNSYPCECCDTCGYASCRCCSTCDDYPCQCCYSCRSYPCSCD